MKNGIVKRLGIGLMAGVIACNMIGCGKKNADNNENSNEITANNNYKLTEEDVAPSIDEATEKSIIDGQMSFALNLFRETYGHTPGTNVLVSPESVQYALGMTASGANGSTLDDMMNVLAGGNELSSYTTYMNTHWPKGDSLKLANSIWLNDDAGNDISKRFTGVCKSVYRAQVFNEEFSADTTGRINDWVNEKTDGMIPAILDDVNPDAVMYLINATSFIGDWAEPYKKSDVLKNQIFVDINGNEDEVVMLHSKENTYIHDDDTTGFVKLYDGYDYSFVALLPDEGINFDDYVNSLTGEKFAALIENREFASVRANMPEFSYDYSVLLNDELINMGMGSAFDTSADFSRMGKTDTGELYIAKVYHKTFISVDRKGTRAGAATAVEMDKAAAPMEEDVKVVTLNRPYVYAIIDNETNLPIFVGTVTDFN